MTDKQRRERGSPWQDRAPGVPTNNPYSPQAEGGGGAHE